MNRVAFLGGLGAFAAACAPHGVAAQDVALEDLIARIPGITGVWAQSMSATAPAAAIRDGEPFASASVMKLFIMIHAYRAYDAAAWSPERIVRPLASDLIGGSDVLAGSAPGRPWRTDTLVRAMIRQSDNSASNALITAFGMDAINATIREIGAGGTRLARHFADVVPAWRRSENVTTPRDVGSALFAIERGAREAIPTVATPGSCRAMVEVLLGQTDRDKIPAGLPGVPVANKTGEIDQVRNDAAIVDPNGDAPYVLVVLTRGLRNYGGALRGIAAIARRVDGALRRAS